MNCVVGRPLFVDEKSIKSHCMYSAHRNREDHKSDIFYSESRTFQVLIYFSEVNTGQPSEKSELYIMYEKHKRLVSY